MTQQEALEMAFEMEYLAIKSRSTLSPFPFYWVFEDFCKKHKINCTFDFVSKKYLISI